MTRAMDQDANYGSKLLKLFRMLMADSRPHYLTDLALKLNCSRQTVMRMMDVIGAELGTNLETGKEGRNRYYKIRTRHRGLRIPDSEELAFIEICRDLARPYLPEQIRLRLNEYLHRLSCLRLGFDPEPPTGFSFSSKGYINYTPFYDTILTLLKAIADRRVTQLEYQSPWDQEPKKHIFAPATIVSQNGALYAYGASVSADGATLRHPVLYSVHRIVSVKVMRHCISCQLPVLDEDSFGLPFHPRRTYEIVFAAGAAAVYVKERIFTGHQSLEELGDGAVKLTLTTTSSLELEAWVRSFGDAVLSFKEVDAKTEAASRERK